MKATLGKKTRRVVTPAAMKEGEIGIIIEWKHKAYIGKIVQKGGNNTLFEIGGESFFNPNGCLEPDEWQVELLERGDTIVFE